jgi:proteasome maturation protein
MVSTLRQLPQLLKLYIYRTDMILQSLRIVPQKAHASHAQLETSAPSAPGVHDNLRSRLGHTTTVSSGSSSNKPVALQSAHPLEARLVQWRETQDRVKMEMLRRQFGIAEPVRRGMELKITEAGEWRPAALGPSAGVHRDILQGRDTEIGWEDVFTGTFQHAARKIWGLSTYCMWQLANILLQATSSVRYQTSTLRLRRR